MVMPLMKCGHTAQAVDSDGNPACIICHGITGGATEVDDSPPDLAGRRARCTYYGKSYKVGVRYGSECSECNKRYKELQFPKCYCERDSNINLAFFNHRPGQSFDEFYCGCHSWS